MSAREFDDDYNPPVSIGKADLSILFHLAKCGAKIRNDPPTMGGAYAVDIDKEGAAAFLHGSALRKNLLCAGSRVVVSDGMSFVHSDMVKHLLSTLVEIASSLDLPPEARAEDVAEAVYALREAAKTKG